MSLKIVSKCNSLEITDSLKQPKDLASILVRLELKGKKFNIFQSATQQEIEDFWEILLTIDSFLTRDDTTQKSLEKLKSLQHFISHCCTFHKYSLTIRKCGVESCTLSTNQNASSNFCW